jgi:hypothetical protein
MEALKICYLSFVMYFKKIIRDTKRAAGKGSPEVLMNYGIN